MNILRSNPRSKEGQKEFINLLRPLAEYGNPEACWRLSALLIQCDLAEEGDLDRAQEYLDISCSFEIAEGYYWYYILPHISREERIFHLKRSSKLGLPIAQFWFGQKLFYGYQILKNETKGIELMMSSGKNGDSYCAQLLLEAHQAKKIDLNDDLDFIISRVKKKCFDDCSFLSSEEFVSQ